MNKVLMLAAIGEAATGVALLVVPALVGRLLLGEDLTGIAVVIARVTGAALLGLGLACWPGPPLLGMLTYGLIVTAYLGHVAFAGLGAGVLLWPVVGLHAVLTVLLGLALTRSDQAKS